MDPQKPKTSAKDFFLNLGAIVALYTTVVSLLNLLFTVINQAYPKITDYYYVGSSSISFPVATLIIFFPIFILLSWFLEKSYLMEPEKKNLGVRKWLTYITLFIAGLTLAGDLVTVLYYFLDGQEMTTGFLLKVLSVLVVTGLVFLYYISDIRKTLTSHEKKSWVVLALLIIVASIVWGFAVLGSPWTQQLYKYDQQRVSDLQSISGQVQNYFYSKNVLPESLVDLATLNNYYVIPTDPQTHNQYEYIKTSDTTFEVCAVFNKANPQSAYPGENIGYTYLRHSAGRYCLSQTITKQPVAYPQVFPVPVAK